MYQLFVEKDLDLVEINPLGIGANGEMMALDGKITVNDNALGRHQDLVKLATPPQAKRSPNTNESIAAPLLLKCVEEKGNIGILCNGVGLTLATWDLLSEEKGKLACCFVVGAETGANLLSSTTLAQQLEQALEQLIEVEELKVILVNILASPAGVQTVAEAIADYLQPVVEETSAHSSEERMERPTSTTARTRRERSSNRSKGAVDDSAKKSQPQMVIRLVGGDLKLVKERLAAMPIHWTDNLDKAVSQTVSLASE